MALISRTSYMTIKLTILVLVPGNSTSYPLIFSSPTSATLPNLPTTEFQASWRPLEGSWDENCKRKRESPPRQKLYISQSLRRWWFVGMKLSQQIGWIRYSIAVQSLTFDCRRRSQTLQQNYRRLGLASRLNTRAGGVEKFAQAERSDIIPLASYDPLALQGTAAKILIPAEAQVERDPTTGAIIRVLLPENHRPNPLNDPLNAILDSYSPPALVPGGIVAELEEQATFEIKVRPRQQSKREEEWIERLVERYGDNYGAMMRDMKLNPYQQTEGDIRRRIKKWKSKGG